MSASVLLKKEDVERSSERRVDLNMSHYTELVAKNPKLYDSLMIRITPCMGVYITHNSLDSLHNTHSSTRRYGWGLAEFHVLYLPPITSPALTIICFIEMRNSPCV